ncbi:MAG TPA: hypothetical protein VK191_05560 [Symbiobacteriaceae bacterium]|nr:hypothetical protein [Symbiobacteriaceae bacterium]
MLQRFSLGLAAMAGLLSLLGSMLAPAAVRIQPYPGLFPGPAAPGLGLPFAEPHWPLTGALLAGLVIGLAIHRVTGVLNALGYSSAVLVWGMLWGGGLTERGLAATGLIGLLAAVYVASAEVQSNRWRSVRMPGLLLLLLPHALCVLFLLGQIGLSSPLGLTVSIGLTHFVLSLRGAQTRPLLIALFLLQSALLVLGTALFPLLPGW